jgi:anion-transporting  ArsA/GET3 family ATPase
VDQQSRIILLCGKGGVGKTTLSLALGLRQANLGRRVVIVSSHPLTELAVSVSLEGLADRSPIAARNLFVVHLNARELLNEVVEKHFPIAAVARTVMNSSIFKNLIEIAPGLKEFYFLARLQQLAERTATAPGTPAYDMLIWDTPASGHFLTTLRAARAFETYLSGPLAAAGADLDRFFSTPGHLQVVPVTSLEEMAITETMEMTESLKREFHLRPRSLILNMVSPLMTADAVDVEKLRHHEGSSPALRFAVERGIMERERGEEIRATLPVPQIAIPRIRQWKGDLDLLEQVGHWMELPSFA